MGFIKNFVKALFGGTQAAALESQPEALAVLEPKATWSWESGAVALPESVVVYTLSSPTEGLNMGAKTKTSRARTGIEGGSLMGPGRDNNGKALNPTLSGFVKAVNGDVAATIYGDPINGHRLESGLQLRFAIDSFLDEKVYSQLASAIAKTGGRFQLLVTCVHATFNPGKKYFDESAPFNHEWRPSKFGNIQLYTAPVKVLSLEVILPGDSRWVTVEVEGINLDGVHGTKAAASPAELAKAKKAHKARLAKMHQVFSSFEEFAESVTTAPSRTSLAGVGDAPSKFELKRPELTPANTEDEDEGPADVF